MVHDLVQEVALAHPPLPGQHLDNRIADEGLDAVKVSRTCYKRWYGESWAQGVMFTFSGDGLLVHQFIGGADLSASFVYLIT